MARTLEEDQCGVCGCYCFGSTPYPWKVRQTPSGLIQLCMGCDEECAGVADPVKERRIRRVSSRLARALNAAERVGSLEIELGRLTCK